MDKSCQYSALDYGSYKQVYAAYNETAVWFYTRMKLDSLQVLAQSGSTGKQPEDATS